VSSSPVRVGILGAGNVLSAYLQALDRLIPRGLAMLGPVCARRRETWPKLQALRPGVQLVSSPGEVLQSDVDVVVVITPPASHAEFVEKALEHGTHVIAEKPLALTFAEAKRLVNLARDRKLHLLCAPFVQLSPTFRAFWSCISDGAVGKVHATRGLYGNAGSTWAGWYHDGQVGPLAELGIYNLKSLTAIAGPVQEVLAAETTAVRERQICGEQIPASAPDSSQVIIRHTGGALSSIVASHAIQRYKRPGLEIYGTDGTANLVGDDWDPRGFEIWRNDAAFWEEHEPIEPTWLWTDGLRELILAIRENREPLHNTDHDLHLLEVIDAARLAASERSAISVRSRFCELNLRIDHRTDLHHLHDHTRPADEQ
jgi:predicted dehydrogenase